MLYLGLSIAYLTIGDRTETITLQLIFGGFFLVYIWGFSIKDQFNYFDAVLLRLPFFISIPFLSDDFYRFIWDAKQMAMAINPYLYTPSDLVAQCPDVFFQKLLPYLNSPHYYTVYPPFNQWLFLPATFSENTDGFLIQANFLRLGLLLFELATIFFIKKIASIKKLNQAQVFYAYAFNPLVIIEIIGNVHYEGVVVCFLLGFYFWHQKQQLLASSLSLGLAVATKLITLIFVPLLIYQLKWKKALLALTIIALLNSLFFLPYLDFSTFDHLFQSIVLFKNKFEFNAGLWYVIRFLGQKITGFNVLFYAGPFFSLCTLLGIIWISISPKFSLYWKILAIYTIYLMFSTTIHPWYLIVPLAISILGQSKFYLLWSYLIFWSYTAYTLSGVIENHYLIALEFVLLFAYFYLEFYRYNQPQKS